MSDVFLHKRIGYRLLVFLGILLLGVLLVFAGMQFVLIKLNENCDKIVTKLKDEFGYPLTFESIEAHWFGFSFGVSLKNVVILDPSEPIPFLAIDTIKIFPDFKHLLLSNELQLNYVELQNLKLLLGWDNKKNITLMGLKGELLPTSIDYQSIMLMASKLKKIVVRSSEIEWRGPTIQFKQWIRGEFNSVQSSTVDWKFSGTQQLQIRNGEKLPESNFNLSVSPGLQNVALKLGGGGLFAQFNLDASQAHNWDVDIRAETQHLNIAEIHDYYHPASTDSPFLQWLFAALPKGKITLAHIAIKGPYKALTLGGEIHFKSTDIKYLDQWPKIEKARGSIKIENERVFVKLLKGTIMGSPIESANAEIVPILVDEDPTVLVEGKLESTLEKGLLFLENTPLSETVLEQLSPLNPKGPMSLSIKCKFPLDSKPSSVDGSLLVKSGQLQLPDSKLGISEINGTFQFHNSELSASNIVAEIEELPIDLNIKTTNHGKEKLLEITANAAVDSAFLQEKFPIPILKRFHGSSLFTLIFKKTFDTSKSTQTDWILSSDLEGMKIDLPDFLGKPEVEKRRSILKVSSEIKGERRIALEIPKRLDAKLVTTGPMDQLNIKRGYIVLGSGHADWTSKSSLSIRGEIAKFKREDWSPVLDEITNDHQKNFPPLDIHLLINQIELYGLRFEKTLVAADFSELPLKWYLDGSSIKGSFVAATKQTNIDLAYLKINSSSLSSDTKIALHIASLVKVPVRFYCEDLQYNRANFGEVSFKLFPAAYGYKIQDVIVETPNSELSGSGEWHLGGEDIYTTLQGKLTSVNMGETLTLWDYSTAIRESSGSIQYQFRWPKHPFQFKLGILDGSAELKFDKGRILGVNPGLGRIMGLLNVENIQRRLQLDFSDLLKKGFVFDTLKGKFQFQKGVAKTETLSIDGPSAKITLVGKANMSTKAVDLEMVVTPHIGVGIPLAAAIAVGNPAVGAGIWIIDKLTGSKINKINRHYYQVTGTWDSPSIKEVATKPVATATANP